MHPIESPDTSAYAEYAGRFRLAFNGDVYIERDQVLVTEELADLPDAVGLENAFALFATGIEGGVCECGHGLRLGRRRHEVR